MSVTPSLLVRCQVMWWIHWRSTIPIWDNSAVTVYHLWHLIALTLHPRQLILVFVSWYAAVMSHRLRNSSFRIEPIGLMAIPGIMSGPLSAGTTNYLDSVVHLCLLLNCPASLILSIVASCDEIIYDLSGLTSRMRIQQTATRSDEARCHCLSVCTVEELALRGHRVALLSPASISPSEQHALSHMGTCV